MPHEIDVPGLERPASCHRGRAALAQARSVLAWRHLECCTLCAHRCGVNRLAGQTGPCRAGATARIFHTQTEVSDELAPLFAVSFSGCDLRCDFCNTGRESWNPSAGQVVSAPDTPETRLEAVAGRARQALAGGARSVMILGGEPTVHLPAALEVVARLPEEARLIWKTNAHATREARDLLQDLFDVWVADYKFGQDDCALRLARIPDYTRIVRENLHWAFRHTDLIVRHLLMPGHLECCWRPIAEWLATELPGVKVSLRTGFWPGWFSHRHPELRQTSTRPEESRALELARHLGLRLIP
jgi:putative pyruvate formate lyase activating enzyme